MHEQELQALVEERAFWRGLLRRAIREGQSGASFQRCIDSIDRELQGEEQS
jgi:hypothetical protein